MSTTTQVALLPPIGRHDVAPRALSSRADARPLVRLAAFGALALWGVTRWAGLMNPSEMGRLMGLFAVALFIAGAGPFLTGWFRWLMLPVAVIGALGAFAISGVPLAWIAHLRIAVTASAIGEGLSALPRAVVPYPGVNQWVRMVIVLGAAVLLFDGALLLAYAPRRMGFARRAGAALPLVALVAVPETLMRPGLPYLAGLLLFGLLAAFMWAERLERDHVAAAVVLCIGAAVAAMAISPALERHSPWLNYEQLATKLAATRVDQFNWAQTYGPIAWPHAGRTVLEVRAARADYWKTEDLDIFNGTGWDEGTITGYPYPSNTIKASAIRRWTQTLTVTLRSMSSAELVAAGEAATPSGLGGIVVAAGESPGTWTTIAGQLGPGDSYTIPVYDPQPSASDLAAAGTDYPQSLLPGYLTIGVPSGLPSSVPAFGSHTKPSAITQVTFPSFGTSLASDYGLGATSPATSLADSPYARAYALAQRLERTAATPYAYVLEVKDYLAQGFFTYSQQTPLTDYPLETFLFSSHQGYCQQFAGAMALLLRMGGVPARVAVGFTHGSYDSATRRWLVSDLDAHAWVEAWFPGYGWVKFDPTPAADPALGGHVKLPAPAGGANALVNKGLRKSEGGNPTGGGRTVGRRGSGSTPVVVWLVPLGIVLLGLAGAAAVWTRPLAPGEAQLDELERAFARSGRPLAPGATLAGVERRLEAAPAAAAYVRALRLSRFGPASPQPTRQQRRALRAQLAAGLGVLGRIRALWALPPRRPTRHSPAGA